MDSPTKTTVPSPLKEPSNTPATLPDSEMEPSDTEEYETAFTRLQKMKDRLSSAGDEGSSNKRERRRGYGVSSLESLSANVANVDGEEDSLEGEGRRRELDIGTFAMDDIDNRRTGGMFDSQDLEDWNEEMVSSSVGRRKKSAVMSEDDEMADETPMEEAVTEEKDEPANGNESEEEEMEYTEASGYGFSQGLRALHAEEDETSRMDAEDEEEQPEHAESQDHTKPTKSEPSDLPPKEPTDASLYALVDSIFSTADKNTMTVKQVNKSVAAHFGMEKVDKRWRGLIKERLTKLVTGELGVGEGIVGDDGGKKSKKDGKGKKEKKKSKDKRAKTKKVKQPKEDIPDEDSFEGDAESEDEAAAYDTSSDYDEAKPKTKKSRKPTDPDHVSARPRKSKGKMAQHLRDHATKLRTRHLEEARIRSEEMGKIQSGEDAPKLSEEDRARAQAIAARFDTNREEEVVKREEERRGLIEGLRRKRLEIITLEEAKVEVKEEHVFGDVVAEQKDQPGVMVDLDDDESSEDEGDELEIVAPAAATKAKKPSALDCLNFKPGDKAPQIERGNNPKPMANPRLALRNALRAKQMQAGNRWLARELGYKTEEEHIRDCKETELKKQKQILFLEQQAAFRKDRPANPAFDVSAADEDAEASAGEEEDEEAAMARQLEDSEVKSDAGSEAEEEEMGCLDDGGDYSMHEDDVMKDDVTDQPAEISEAKSTVETSTPAPSPSTTVSTVVSPSGSRQESNSISNDESPTKESTRQVLESTEPDGKELELTESLDAKAAHKAPVDTNTADEDLADSDAEDSTPTEEETKSKKPKNSAWQAMLRKEKESLAKQKKLQRKGGGLVEGEAEEEEEEEGIVGLEEFGFSVEKKKGDDSDDDADADEDDLEHVVDELSDNEGDEEAGEQARKRLEAREEKERHKEIMRRMREGYDGRRGGIASGGGRGIHRFDQLVAADNREDAKRLGLLNEDEMDSDGEENETGEKTKKDAADDDDEAALLDRMLKERFLNREEEEILEENFSDDEEQDADEEEAKEGNPEDDEEKEQDRLAKRFAKRARMNRILEAYEGDNEFSRSRLIDEDASMQIELKTMKTTQSKKRGSLYSESNSNLVAGFFKQQKSNDASNPNRSVTAGSQASSKFTSQEGILSLALMASSAGRKRKTTFLSGKQNVSLSRQNSSSSKSISLGHVVFVTGESQSASQFDSFRSSSNLGKRSSTKSSSSASVSGSLWNKVCSRNWSGK